MDLADAEAQGWGFVTTAFEEQARRLATLELTEEAARDARGEMKQTVAWLPADSTEALCETIAATQHDEM